MATKILSLFEQRNELAVIWGLADALAVCWESYDLGMVDRDGLDLKIQERCEAAFESLIPEIAQRTRKLYESAHETHGSNVVRLKEAQ